MLRAAMALLSTLQIGARIKESFERSLKQAAVIAVAVVFLAAAAVFGLIAAYHALVSIYQFDAAEAAAIMAGVLLVIGLVVIAIAFSMGRPPKQAPALAPLASVGDPTAMLDQGVGKAMQQVGPVPLLAVAFIAGVLFGRR
ncbi:MAG TPA: hypothetical protein VF090_03980 [Methyloceanibacter sp.]